MFRRDVLVLVALLGTTGSALAQDLPGLEKRGTLRVILEKHMQAERYSIDPNGPPGLEKEILQGFASLHKLRLETVVADRTEDRISFLQEGKGDVVVGIVVTDSRRKQVAFTTEVLPIRHIVVTRKPDTPVQTLAELRARRVGATKGSSWAEMARAAGVPESNVDDTFAAPDGCLEALRTGKVGALIMSTAWAVVARNNDPELELGVFVGPPTTAAFAVRKSAPLLQASLDEYVTNLRRTATWSRLVVKYFHEAGLEILKRSRPEAASR